MHFLWDHFAEGEDDALAEAVVNLNGALPLDDLPARGAQSRLQPAQLSTVGLEDVNDPSLANGFHVITELACHLDALEAVFIATNQDELHEGSYDGYLRTYTSSVDDYLARQTPHLTWDGEIQASPAGFDYIEHISGGVRRLPTLDSERSPFGDVLLGRTWLLEPATEDSENRSFDQDYQLDIYYEREPGLLVHTYVIWRQVDFGALGDQDSAALIAVTLSESEKWDKATVELCGD